MVLVGDYVIESSLGRGTFGQVVLGRNVETGRRVAIKICDQAGDPRNMDNAIQEIRLLSGLKHMNIVQLYEVFNDKDFVYIVLEYVPGGELFDYIAARCRVKEKDARGFLRQIVEGIKFFHEQGIVHRDLKPENILVDLSHNVKIIDFGLAHALKPLELLTGQCGSPHYTSPEMLAGEQYGTAVDMWSLGVILFALLCGYLPFDDSATDTLKDSITQAHYCIPSWLSDRAKHLIRSLLVVDPVQRATASDVLRHPWLTGPPPGDPDVARSLERTLEEQRTGATEMPGWQLSKEIRVAELLLKRRSVIDQDLQVRARPAAPAQGTERARAASSLGFLWGPMQASPAATMLEATPQYAFTGFLPPVAEVDEELESMDSGDQVSRKRPVTEGMDSMSVADTPQNQAAAWSSLGAPSLVLSGPSAGQPFTSPPMPPPQPPRRKLARRMSDTWVTMPYQKPPDDPGASSMVFATPGQGPVWAMTSSGAQPPAHRHSRPSRGRMEQRAPSYSTLPFPESAVTSLATAEIMPLLKEVLEAHCVAALEVVAPFSVVATTAPDPTGSIVELQISVYRLSNLADMHVLVGHRRRGDVWLYCALLRSVIDVFTKNSGDRVEGVHMEDVSM